MNPILPIDATFTQNALAYVGQVFTDLNTVILVLLGVPVGFWVVSKAISLFRKNTRTAGGGRGARYA